MFSEGYKVRCVQGSESNCLLEEGKVYTIRSVRCNYLGRVTQLILEETGPQVWWVTRFVVYEQEEWPPKGRRIRYKNTKLEVMK